MNFNTLEELCKKTKAKVYLVKKTEPLELITGFVSQISLDKQEADLTLYPWISLKAQRGEEAYISTLEDDPRIITVDCLDYLTAGLITYKSEIIRLVNAGLALTRIQRAEYFRRIERL